MSASDGRPSLSAATPWCVAGSALLALTRPTRRFAGIVLCVSGLGYLGMLHERLAHADLRNWPDALGQADRVQLLLHLVLGGVGLALWRSR